MMSSHIPTSKSVFVVIQKVILYNFHQRAHLRLNQKPASCHALTYIRREVCVHDESVCIKQDLPAQMPDMSSVHTSEANSPQSDMEKP